MNSKIKDSIDLEHKIYVSFAFIDGELHKSEKAWLENEWDIKKEEIELILRNISSDKQAFDLFSKSVKIFPDIEERRSLVLLSLKEIAWADGRLDEREKRAFNLIKREWKISLNLDSSGWKPTTEQEDIIKAPISDWIRVVAKPGTGKTATACARAAHLINEGEDPSKIWMMSFTRTAIREISDRVKDLSDLTSEDGFGELPFNGLKISTIDSQAGKIRYGFSDTEARKIFGSHDASLSEASKLLSDPDKENEVLSFFKKIKHLILDEAQDITDERAVFIGDLLSQLTDSCGVTILEDPAQAIYSGEIHLEEILIAKGIKGEFTEKNLSIIHRTGNKALLEFIEQFHEQAAYRLECSTNVYKEMQLKIESVANKNIGLFNPNQVQALEEEFSDSLVLFRERGEVLTASYKIGEKESGGFYHRIRMGNKGAPIYPWLAYIFWDQEEDEISKKDFINLWKRKSPHPWINNLSSELIWQDLYTFSPLKNKKLLDLRLLRRKLSSNSVNPRFCNPDLGMWGPILGTIHGSKGREASNVMFYKGSAVPRNEDRRGQEARVMYVAATRPKESLQVGLSERGNFRKLDSQRIFNKYQNSIRMEVGLAHDYDKLSVVDKNFYPEEDMTIGIQNELIEISDPDKKIPSLQAVRLPEDQSYAYEIRQIGKNTNEKLGKFNNNNFKNDVFNASKLLGVENNTPYIMKTFHLLGCGSGVISYDDERINSLHKPFNKSGMWLFPIVSGMPYLNFRRS